MMAGSSDQMEEKLKATQADKQHVERQEAAGQCVLTRTRDEKNKLQDANTQLGEELKDVRAQLADALKENRKLRGGIFSMSYNLLSYSSLMRILTSFMSADVLIGRPEEEVSGFQGDLLQELSKVHERAQKAMINIAKALWPTDSPPGSMEELMNLLRELGAVLGYGRYQHAEKVLGNPGPW